MFLCIMMMLFGSHVQNLWCDPQFDGVFDILFSLVFCLFLVDIGLRILVVPGYVSFKYKGVLNTLYGPVHWIKTVGGNTHGNNNKKGSRRYRNQGVVEEDPEKWGKINIGSFLFWCDVISTASLLYEISYINKSKNRIMELDIQLDPLGIPVSARAIQHSSASVYSSLPVEYFTNIYLFIFFPLKYQK